MKHKKCATCWWALLRDHRQLEDWLLERLGAEFAYRWSCRDELGREEPGLIHPEHYARWLERGPCVDCPCADHCDRICLLRARWWDAKMDGLRRRLGLKGGR